MSFAFNESVLAIRTRGEPRTSEANLAEVNLLIYSCVGKTTLPPI